jgi:hypothetical protein
MAAPFVSFIVAFLTSATLPGGAAQAILGGAAQAALVVDRQAATVYADLPAICAATDAPLDRLSDAADAAKANSVAQRVLGAAADRLARDADIVCNDSQRPNTSAGRLQAVAAALADIARADKLIPPTKAAAH